MVGGQVKQVKMETSHRRGDFKRSTIANNSSAENDAFGAKVAVLNKKIIGLQAQVLERRLDVYKCKARQEKIKNANHTSQMLRAWQKSFGTVKGPDQKLRPPDQKYPVRNVSRMDADVWASEELRGWFDRRGDLRTPAHLRAPDPMAGTAYGVPNIAMAASSTFSQAAPLSGHGSYYGYGPSSSRRAGGRRPGGGAGASSGSGVSARGAHWFDHEGNLRAQKKAAAASLRDRARELGTPSHGHAVGTFPPPWQEYDATADKAYCPRSQLQAREKALLQGQGLQGYTSDKYLTYTRKLDMEAGSGLFDASNPIER